jgi:LysM repeat protein
MSGSFQKELALAVASSVKEYLSGTASIARSNDAVEMTDIGVNQGEAKPARKANGLAEVAVDYYKIKTGDTLFSIARQFNTKVTFILKLNDRKMEDPLYAGLKILVPVNKNAQKISGTGDTADKTGSTDDAGPSCRIYVVKKGDTLFSLARKNSLTIDELRNLNKLKGSDTLLSGRKIKLPEGR